MENSQLDNSPLNAGALAGLGLGLGIGFVTGNFALGVGLAVAFVVVFGVLWRYFTADLDFDTPDADPALESGEVPALNPGEETKTEE